MAIYVPGKRYKRSQRLSLNKRNVVAVLQLTAMVDMFTVLVVFLLQNYASTNQILPIEDQIDLPKASSVKELKPSLVVTLSKDYLSYNDKKLISFQDIQNSSRWLLEPLLGPVKQTIDEMSQKNDSEDSGVPEDEPAEYYKMTLQVDKDIDFLSVKKVLYTLTEAGLHEINFAVIKVKAEDRYGLL